MKRAQKSSSLNRCGAMSRFEKALRHSGLVPKTVSLFQKMVYSHYRHHGRKLPWRMTGNPYHILVSEVMLQQTQVDRVLSKYRLFLRAFPDFLALARAPLRDILAVWQGLGYNRRTLALKKTAQQIVEQLDGKLPAHMDGLLSLPGVGKATASAVIAFAFNQPVAFLETNIRTVFIHFFFRNRKKVPDDELLPLVEETMDRSNPRIWYHALMDFGVMLKKRYQNPGRKSVHHKGQTPFKGSDRQIRGMILRILLQKGSISQAQLERDMPGQAERVQRIVTQLQKEHLINKRGCFYTIA